MTEFQEHYGLVITDPSAVAAAESAKARIQAAYIMAINRPRNADDARVRILEACKRPEFAARVEFAKPVAGRSIKGPSIRFAETALRLWGNIDSDISVVYDDEHFRRVKIRVTDLETNATFTKEINIRKTVERRNTTGRDGAVLGERINSRGEKVFIVQSTDDELMNKENALISKAIRNEGLRLIPSDIIDEAIITAQETLRNRDAKDPASAKKRVMDSFSSIGIKPKELERYLKHPLDTLSPSELENLRSIYTAIKEGDATWVDYMPSEDTKYPAQPVEFNNAPAPEPEPHKRRGRRSKEEMEAEKALQQAKEITENLAPPEQEPIFREPGEEG